MLPLFRAVVKFCSTNRLFKDWNLSEYFGLHIFTLYLVKCRYADIISKAQERHQKLEESIKQHGMLREVKEVESWIQDKVCMIFCQF